MTLCSILADFNDAVVCMLSTCPLISKCPCISLLVIVQSIPTTTGIIVTIKCHLFIFSSLARSWSLSLFSFSFIFTLWSAGTAKSTIQQVLVFFLLLTTLANVKEFFKRSKVYQPIYDRHLMLNSKMLFVYLVSSVFKDVLEYIITSCAQLYLLFKCLWTLLVTADRGCLMFCTAYAVCVAN